MPYKSLAQEGYFHTHKAQLEKEGVDVGEWDKATKGKKLPMKAKKHVDKTSKTKMSAPMDKVTYLKSINSKLETRFDYSTEDDQNNPYKRSAIGAVGLVGTGAGGVLGHQAIKKTGGYAANMSAARYGADALGRATGNVAANSGAVGAALHPAISSGKNLLKSILSKLRPAATAMSSKTEEIRLAGGYGNTGIGVRKERGAGSHFNRAAFRYGSLPLAAPTMGLSLPVGYLIDRSRAKQNILKTRGEPKENPALTKGHVYSDKHGKLIELNSKLSDVVEFKIEIKEKNRGKFNATKKETGESTEELEHSRNPKTRKRAVFAANAAKWNKK